MSKKPSKKKGDDPKLDLINRKVAPKLRMFANGDTEVSCARAENNPSLAIDDASILKDAPRRRVDAPPDIRRKKHGKKKLNRPIGAAKASVFVQFSDTEAGDAAPSEIYGETRRRGAIATAEIPLDKIAEVSAREDVTLVEAGDIVRTPPVLMTQEPVDTRPPTIMARKVLSQKGKHNYGEDVLIGIIDVGGIAFAHEDFLEDGQTRIERIWDMGGDFRTPPERFGFRYGAEFKRSHLNAAIKTAAEIGVSPYAIEPQHHQQRGSHGTHVASIAAGNRGICRNARIACVMLDLAPDDFDRRKSFYDSARIAHAIDYLIRTAHELGGDRPLPLSINISLGTNGHAHDGSSAVSRWIDNALAQPGRVVSVAAGNAGQESAEFPGDLGYVMGRIHSSGKIAAKGLTNTLDWIVVGDGVADISENEMEIWYEPQDRFAVTVFAPGSDGEVIGPVEPGEFIENRELSDGSFISIYNELYRPANGANTISIYLSPRLKEPILGVGAGQWRVALSGEDVRDGRYHVWIERDDPRPLFQRRGVTYAAYPSFFSERSNVDAYSVSSLACGERILSIGNYDRANRRANISSSQGPTRTERLKPEILAPGTDIVAANGFAGPDDPWIGMTGTSMASPYAAGVAGLMLAINPDLTAAQIIGIMRRTAKPVDDADYRWRDDHGFGLIDEAACVDEASRVETHKDIT